MSVLVEGMTSSKPEHIMRRIATMLKLSTIALAIAALGCASFGRASPTLANACQPQQCWLDVQNDDAQMIVVRYYDSTGVGDMLGLVQGVAVRRFVLSRRTSRTITVEVTRDRQVFHAQTTLSLPPVENRLHFPADFDAALIR